MVGIALLTLVPGEVGGSETYVRGLTRALHEVGELDYRVLAPPLAPDAGEGLRTEIATGYGRRRTTAGRLAAMTRAAARPGALQRSLADADVVHYPLTLRVPRIERPYAVTLHDLQHLDLPQLFSRAERVFRDVAWHRAVRHADRVIVMSEFVRGRAIELLGLDPGRIDVIPLGLDHALLRPGGEREPFLYYPARRWPHKNHERLFAAFADLRRERPDLRLVLTGGGTYPSVPDGVDVRGHVPYAEVVRLLQTAAALVFPSLYEGFGLPPLEAMACGCPVACSSTAALPEIVGDAACLFDPLEPSAIAGALREVLADPGAWTARGLARASLFSWHATARAHDSVYRSLSTGR